MGKTLIFVFLGGGIGSVSRYLVMLAVHKNISSLFPFGTFTVNTLGSLFIGIAFGVFDRLIISQEAKLFITTGFLGGFTTFSTFAFENAYMLKNGEYRFFWINIFGQNLAALTSALLGVFLTRYFFKLIAR